MSMIIILRFLALHALDLSFHHTGHRLWVRAREMRLI